MVHSHWGNDWSGLMEFRKGQGHLSLDGETAKHKCSGMPARESVQPKLLIEWPGVCGTGRQSNWLKAKKNPWEIFHLRLHIGNIRIVNQQSFQKSGNKTDKAFEFCLCAENQNPLDTPLGCHTSSDMVKYCDENITCIGLCFIGLLRQSRTEL